MEADGASEHRPLDVCVADVRSCAAYVGILGFRYGSCPPGDARSYTEHEYEEAGKNGVDRFMFLATDSVVGIQPKFVDTDRTAIDAFRRRVGASHSIAEFSTEDELARKLARTIRQQLPAGQRPLGRLLPYLCDRQDQIDAIHQYLARRQQRRPLLLILYGDRRERHARFVDRLQLSILRDALDVPETEHVHKIDIRWPETNAVRRYSDWFTRELATADHPDRRAATRELAAVLRQLASTRAPVLVSTALEITQWSRGVAEGIRAFARFWDESPEFPSSHPLIACLAVSYPPPQRSWWPFGRANAERIVREVEALDLASFQDVTIGRIPRLGADSLSRQHVENWIKVDLARVSELTVDEDALRSEIATFFERYEQEYGSPLVPMGDFADHLRRLFEAQHLGPDQERNLFV
jgi:hypothetical protein